MSSQLQRGYKRLSDHRQQPGAKKPQLLQNHPQVLTRTGHQRFDRIAEGAVQIVAAQVALALHVPNDRLDRIRPAWLLTGGALATGRRLST